jgi:hypothetical protein
MTIKEQLRDNPKYALITYTIVPILLFAFVDHGFWGVLSDFGTSNSWHLVTIDLQIIHNNQIAPITLINSPFLIASFTVIVLNILLYQKSTKKQSPQKM